jgi:hypothetical protein
VLTLAQHGSCFHPGLVLCDPVGRLPKEAASDSVKSVYENRLSVQLRLGPLFGIWSFCMCIASISNLSTDGRAIDKINGCEECRASPVE